MNKKTKEKLKQLAKPSERDALKELEYRRKNRDILAEKDRMEIKRLINKEISG